LGLLLSVISESPLSALQIDSKNAVRIYGLVVDGETNQPLGDVRLWVDSDQTKLLLTDAEGQFSFDHIIPGSHILYATKAGYMALRVSGRKIPGNTGIPLIVTAPSPGSVVLRLFHSPKVSGSIFDENGDPLPRAHVTPFVYWYDDLGGRTIKLFPFATTDDRGQFEFNSIDTGKYGFIIDGPTPSPSDRSQNRSAYVPYFYPEGTDPSNAQLVEIDAGAEVKLNRVILLGSKGGAIRVHINNETGGPFTGPIRIAVHRRTEMELSKGTVFTSSTNQEEEEIANLPPGSYEIEADSTTAFGKAHGKASLAVRSVDIEADLTVRTVASIAGNTMVRGAESVQTKPVSGFQVQLTDISGNVYRINQAGDGAVLSVSNIPVGSYQIAGVRVPPGLYLDTIYQGERNVLVDGVRVEAGGNPPLRVILDSSPALIHGTATDASDQKVSGAIIVVVPDDPSQMDKYSVTTADENGTFVLSCGPGIFRLMGWRELNGAAYLNADFMKAVGNLGQKLTLQKHDTITANLTVLEDE